MEITFDQAIEQLRSYGVQFSYQRTRILSYLIDATNHPRAEEIYQALKSEIPSLSRTTVYNTLDLLVRVGLVRPLHIEEKEQRYEMMQESHGHFKCEACGRVFDFAVDLASFETKELEGFEIRQRDLFLRGVCADCQENKEE